MNADFLQQQRAVTDAFERLCATYRHGLNPLFDDHRKRAERTFHVQGLPPLKSERYRYTPLVSRLRASLAKEVFLQTPQTPLDCLPGIFRQAGEVISWGAPLPTGRLYVATSLTAGHRRFPALFDQYFDQQAAHAKDPWVALHTRLLADGLFLYLPPGVVLEEPLVLHHHYPVATLSSVAFPRLFIVMGAQSRATLIETCSAEAPDRVPLLHRLAEVVLEEGSQLTYAPLQATTPPSTYLRHTYVQQQRESRFVQYHVTTFPGDACLRDATELSLAGTKAFAHLQGLYSAQATQHLALHADVCHQAPHTTVAQQYRGVVEGKATALFDGTLTVPPVAPHTVASQHHKGWILSEGASLFARPQLVIETDEVQCTHGASTMILSPTLRHYMQTRGLPPMHAQELLRQGFFQPDLTAIQHETVRKIASELLTQKEN